MPVWKYAKEPGKEVSEDDLKKALEALRMACFKCGNEFHSDDCPISRAIAAVYITRLKGKVKA